jgi:hypothetical protein
VAASEATAEAFGFADVEESCGFVANYSPGRVGRCSSWRLRGWHCSKGMKASVSKIHWASACREFLFVDMGFLAYGT